MRTVVTKGTRLGQRSVRLNSLWRVIYIEKTDGSIALIEAKEVTPHDY